MKETSESWIDKTLAQLFLNKYHLKLASFSGIRIISIWSKMQTKKRIVKKQNIVKAEIDH